MSLAPLLMVPGLLSGGDGYLRKMKPPMGWNSWNCYHSGVTSADLKSTADFFVSSGLAAAGYSYVNTDDGWLLYDRDNKTSEMFPEGMAELSGYIHSKGLKFGIYSAASSVVCSGRAGSLYNEFRDAAQFAAWNVDYAKYDDCGEYGLGNARFVNFADAVNATGRPMFISTEPYLIVPNPEHATFANSWRTTNDINANFRTILDRADTNDKWADIAKYGINDPDMLEVGNGKLTDGECRVHFGLWAAIKAPLILGTNLTALSPAQLAIVSNKAAIAVNQDELGIQAKKLAADGIVTPRFVGLAPCSAGAEMGYNGVSTASLKWATQPFPSNETATMLVNTETGRCLTMGAYAGATDPTATRVPLLMPCDNADPGQAWILPAATTIGGLRWLPAVMANNASDAFTVGGSTLYGAAHGSDPSLPDSFYGLTNLTLSEYAPEAPCTSRACDDYSPGQMWYWSPRLRTLNLGLMSANHYRCWGPNCQQLTSHMPTSAQLCLSHVLSYDGNVGTNPHGATSDGDDVWGGALAGGDFVMALVNRNSSSDSETISARWAWLEAAGVGETTTFCVTELFSGEQLGHYAGGVQLPVPSHDIALLRLVPGECISAFI
eukprot:gene5235-13696_t